MKTLNVSLLVLVALIQLAVPASMIWSRERTLREGTVYRFRANPIDPYDAFRGRYIAINVGAIEAAWLGDTSNSDRCYAILARDVDGYAKVIAASATPPVDGSDFVRARFWRTHESNLVHVLLPIDRFYLPDSEAAAAEIVYRTHAARGSGAAVVVARIRKGDLVIEDVGIDNIPIRDRIHADSQPNSQKHAE